MKEPTRLAPAWTKVSLMNEWGEYYWALGHHQPVEIPERVRVRWPSGDETVERTEKRREMTMAVHDGLRASVATTLIHVIVLGVHGAEAEVLLDRVEIAAIE